MLLVWFPVVAARLARAGKKKIDSACVDYKRGNANNSCWVQAYFGNLDLYPEDSLAVKLRNTRYTV